jgi:replicative DNA helicase
VIFIHTDDLKAETREINVAKQRNGPVGDMQLAFLARYTKFEALERGQQ